MANVVPDGELCASLSSLQFSSKRRGEESPFLSLFYSVHLAGCRRRFNPPFNPSFECIFRRNPLPLLSPCLFRSTFPPIPQSGDTNTKTMFFLSRCSCMYYVHRWRSPLGGIAAGVVVESERKKPRRLLHSLQISTSCCCHAGPIPSNITFADSISPKTPTQFDSKKGQRPIMVRRTLPNKRFPAFRPKQTPGIAGQW